MSPRFDRRGVLSVAACGVIAASLLGGARDAEGTAASPPATSVASSCAQGEEDPGTEGYLRYVVSDTSSEAAETRGIWALPTTSPSNVVRITSDSVCALAIAGYNSHLTSAAVPLTNAFVFRVDTLYVVDPIWAPGSKHFKLIMVLGQLWQHVASIAA